MRHQNDRFNTTSFHTSYIRLQGTHLLGKIGLMSLQRQRERYIITHIWKIIRGLAPNDIGIKSYEHIRLGTRCSVPPLPKKAPSYAKSILDNSFAVTGPKLWNTLPRSVTCAQSLESFKFLLASHIMNTYPYQPPVPGYTTPNSNSTGWSSWISNKNLQEVFIS